MKIIINGYTIRFNYFWNEWQTNHPNIGVCEPFKTYNEAWHYCQKG